LAKELKVDLSTLKGEVPTVELAEDVETAANKGKQPDRTTTPAERAPHQLHPLPRASSPPAPAAAAQVVPLTTLQNAVVRNMVASLGTCSTWL